MEDDFKSIGQQFVLHTHYPNYKEFENIFEKIVGDDYSTTTTTVSGQQIDIPENVPEFDEPRDKFFKYLEFKLLHQRMYDFKCIRGWTIYYTNGGYQGLHVHTGDLEYNTFSAVIHLDDVIPHEKNKFNGMLFTIMPYPNGFQLPGHYQSHAGGVVALDGRVWHGVYPTDTIRRTIVYDIEFTRK